MWRDRVLRRPIPGAHALGVALLSLVLTLFLAACQPATPVCNTAAALIPGPALTVADGAVYAQARGTLSVLRAGTGTLAWRSSVGSVVFPVPPLLAGGTVIAATGPGALVAYHASDGSVAWHSQPVPRPQTANGLTPPTLMMDSDIVYAGASASSIAAWRVTDGSLLWQSPPIAVPADPDYVSGYPVVPAPVVAGVVVYFSAGQSVRAVRAADGSLLWSSPVLQSENVYTPPVLAGRQLFVEAHDGSLYALDAGTGAILWHAPDPEAAALPPGSPYAPPAPPTVQDGIVYYAPSDGVRALAADTGALLWHLPVYSWNATSSFAVSSGGAYIASSPTLSALDARSGVIRWHRAIQQAGVSSAVLLDGDTLYTVSATAVAAWRTIDGSSLWQQGVHSAGLVSLLHVVLVDGVIYVGTAGMYSCGSPIPPVVSAVRSSDGVLLWQSSVSV